MAGCGRCRIGPVTGRDGAGVGIAAPGEHLPEHALPVDGLGERDPNLDIAEERLAATVRVERDERVGERLDVLHDDVGPPLQRDDLLGLETTHQVGRTLQDRTYRHLGIRNRIRPEDQVVEVWLRVGVGIAVECDRQGVDARDLERTCAHRAEPAVWARDDLRRGHAIEDVLGDDARAQREREGGRRRLQSKHDLVGAARPHTHLAPVHRAGLRVLEVLEGMEGEEHIVRCEGLPVGPLHALPDVDRIGQVVG